ncbi:Putative glycoside hydrolase, family 3, glycoside hydrolase family 3 domain, PA14 [Colletotrichum destructivum]|uniref:beta-glucosidase n=1 Tax=Colletotrichum destructivum TaxID=34406 RepID=A0AAX4IQM4_9PEZI|nr:Putative glycoside hydrolase, family 3, glycoside hydrolase family 3 domain, PA14 [Colletotrichum destructivum]
MFRWTYTATDPGVTHSYNDFVRKGVTNSHPGMAPAATFCWKTFSMISEVSNSAILAALSLDEKISLLAGGSQWRTTAIERLKVPTLKVSDGPSGARGEIFGENVPAAFLPCGVSLGATWDVNLLRELGELLAEECKSKSASVLLAPTICIHRHPLGGRNFESFSEDPFLTGKLAVAHIKGIQSRGVGATPKHFVGNDQETKRFKVNAHISPRALREVYLLPFQMAVREADPWCMMSAYNKVNGHYCDASRELLIDIARNEWKWDGVFMSDWGGTTSTVDSINHGLDLEMPGPPTLRSTEALKDPLRDGLIDMTRIDESASRMLALLEKAGRFQNAPDEPEYCCDNPATRDLLLKAASSGIVLLKNDMNTLPIGPLGRTVSKLAVVGPNAKRVVAGGGGSSYIKAPYWTSVYDSLERDISPHGTEMVFHERREGEQISADPINRRSHTLSLASIGPAKLFVDNEPILEQSGSFDEKSTLFFSYGSGEARASLSLTAGREYHIQIDCLSHDRQLDPVIAARMDPMEDRFQGVRLGYEEADARDLPAEAARMANNCDAAIVVVGRDKEWETEGQDIPIFELPGEQVRLIREVAASCSRTIVVVQAETPVQTKDWIDEVQAVLYTWYQGQELGNASAQIICGKENPSGRLPVTFPLDIKDCPAYSSFPGEQNETYYTEGLYVGYRWWDLVGTKPQYPIGYGLSYNEFAVKAGSISSTTLNEHTPLMADVWCGTLADTTFLGDRPLYSGVA